MEATSKNLTSYLKKYFGFDQFKGQQHEIITSLLNKEDVFVLMPTGGGKSLCYQLPALMSDGVAIIVSPLIALMKNQVDAIRGISENDGIANMKLLIEVKGLAQLSRLLARLEQQPGIISARRLVQGS